jgi:Fic family protein
MVTPEAAAKGWPYRKENPLHRLYYHEICAPEKIGYHMRKLDEWLKSSEFTSLHPVVAATRLQLRLLRAYPWTKNTGKVARLITNYILLRAEYLPAIIHSIDRQRYYEVLRHDNDDLLGLVVESLENGIDTTTRFFDELGGLRTRRAS